MSRKWLLGLKAKLFFMGIAPLLVVLFVSYLNRNTINDLVDRLSMALEVRSRLIEHVGEMDASTHALGRWMWITSGMEGTPEAQSRFIKKASEEIEHFESERLSFLKLVTDQREKDLVMEVTKEWAQARPAAEAAIRTFQSNIPGANEAARQILQKRLMPHLVPMTSTFSELKRIRHQILLQESSDAKIFSDRAIWLTTLLLFLSVLGLGVMTLRIVTSLPKRLSEIAAQISAGSNAVGTTVVELSAASQNMMASTTQQSSAVERTVSAAQEISTIVQRSAELAKNVDAASKESRSQADDGNEIVEKMIKSMRFISENNEDIAVKMTESNEKISSILTVIQNVGAKTKIINEIVFQTKLLSFNASVEAARAGDAGKGFAVVADEVGTLAQMSGVAATEINQLLDESLSKVSGIVEETKARVEAIVATSSVAVKDGTEVAASCGKVLKDLLKSSTQVAEMASDIARANQESSSGVDEILVALRQLDQHASSNAGLADSCKRSSETLLNQMKQFRDASSHLGTVVEGQAPMNRFEWKDSYLLGVAAMDEEHLVLVEKINFLAACFENDLKSAGSAIADLASYATKHFADEEQYMELIRYPDVRAHKQVHQKLLKQVSELGAQVQEGAANPDVLMTFLNDWLVQHILGTDMKYARYSKA